MDEDTPDDDALYGRVRAAYRELLEVSAALTRTLWTTDHYKHVAAAHVDIAAAHLLLASEVLDSASEGKK